ncbi:MAG: glycosyltransferase [Deltaproteobacteria bacterium]|nr:glycosyltransferase [Deltaproteobacteria bacterium]
MEKKIGVCIYNYGLGNSPSLINMGGELVRAGYLVDYFTYKSVPGYDGGENEGIRVYCLDGVKPAEIAGGSGGVSLTGLIRRRAVTFILAYKGLRVISKIFEYVVRKILLADVAVAVDVAQKILENNTYFCFIGIEPAGLAMASALADTQGVPYVYYNMELGMLDDDRKTVDLKILEDIEKKLNRGAAFTIIQDMDRARILYERSGIAKESIYIVPVSAIGAPHVERSDWLRVKLNIPQGNKIILYAGYIADWALCEEIIRAARQWPSDWTLVLHSNGGIDKEYMAKIEKNIGENIKISQTPVQYKDLAALLSSADIGIALYRNLSSNFMLIGSASGKLAHYLKSGLPVITNNYPSIRTVIEKYGCGECIESPEQMKEAIEKILAEYDSRRERAFSCYEARYEFSAHFEKVVAGFGRLEKGYDGFVK